MYFSLSQRKTESQRKLDIDAEISARLKREGAKTGDVAISLAWETKHDLDLHVFCPHGTEINFRKKIALCCGGELDVDMNAQGSQYSETPVENIFWAKGKAPSGKYKVVVQNYDYHTDNHKSFNFKVQVVCGDEVVIHERTMPANTRGSNSNITVCEFEYNGITKSDKENVYGVYAESNVLKHWSNLITEKKNSSY